MSLLANLRRRIYLTYRYRGLGTVLYRTLHFVEFTPLRPLPAPRADDPGRSLARAALVSKARPPGHPSLVPSYRDADRVAELVASIRRTTRTRLGLLGPHHPVRIVVADDASGPEHVAALRRIKGIELVEGEHNKGFAANVNRGIHALAIREHDVVIPELRCDPPAGVAGLPAVRGERRPRRNRRRQAPLPRRPDPVRGNGAQPRRPRVVRSPLPLPARRVRARDAPGPVLAVTGACMYLKRSLIERIGLLDEAYPMAYEDVDYCLQAWRAGYRVLYQPEAELYHLESVTRGTEVRERERASQRVFWERWGEFFDARQVRNADGMLRIIYVTEDTGVGGGHRDVFEHLNGLLERGHEVELWSLGGPPGWFDLRAPVRSFTDYDALVAALKPVEAIKIATWWVTSAPVWEASVTHGIPVYLVQDIETSYYPDSERLRSAVLASYRPEFRYITISTWNRDRLEEIGSDAALIPPGIDLHNFRPLDGVGRREDMVLAIGRSNPLKNLPLTLAAWRALPDPRPELCLFGIEPQLVGEEPGLRYVDSPLRRGGGPAVQ